MNKKLIGIVIAVAYLGSVFSTQPKQVNATTLDNSSNQTYCQNTQVNLKGLNLQIVNNNLKISKKNNILKSLTSQLQTSQLDDNNIANFNKVIQDNSIKNNLINLIKQGKTPVAIATKTVYDEKNYDNKNKQIRDKLLTVKEVKNLKLDDKQKSITPNNAPVGNSIVHGRLTLKLVVSQSSTGQYWLQSGASWDLSGAHSVNSSDSPGVGDDFIALGWNSKYCTQSNPSATGSYQGGGTFTPSVAKIEANSGEAWNFTDDISSSAYSILATRVYAGVGVKNTGSPGYAAFTASYVHTWSSATYSVSISAGGAGISVSPSSSQWGTAVSISGNFS